MPTDIAAYKDIQASGGELVSVVTDPAQAAAALANGSADVAIYAPADFEANMTAGKQSTIRMDYDILSPVRSQYASLLAERLADRVNQAIILRAVTQLKTDAGPAGAQIKPEVIAAPTRAEANNLAPSTPDVTAFYGPAVLALILQHAAITLTALSLVRERRTGIFDIFRVSAASAAEIVLGKALAFAALGALVAALVTALLTGPLHVPLLGDPAQLALALGLLLAASLGIGLLISGASDSERPAVHLSLNLLPASVFRSGLIPSTEPLSSRAVQVGGAPLLAGPRKGIFALLQGSLSCARRKRSPKPLGTPSSGP